LHGFHAYDPRLIEFRLEGGKFTRKGVCPAPLLFKRLLLLDLRLGGLHGFQAYNPRLIEFRLEGGKFTRKGVCPAPLLIERLLLLAPRRLSRRPHRIELSSQR
jgi:hypothetical protein